MTENSKATLAEKWLRKIQNYPVVAVIVVIATVIIGIGAFTDSIGKLFERFHSMFTAQEEVFEAQERTFEVAEGQYRQRRAELISVLYERKETCIGSERRCPPPDQNCKAENKLCPRRSSDKVAVEALKELVALDREHFARLSARMDRFVAAGRCAGPPDQQPDGCGMPADTQTDLRGLDLEGVTLDYADLRNVRLQGSNLTKVSFVLSHLDDANLAQCILVGAEFVRTTLRSSNLNFSIATGANFREADLQGASIMSANLLGAILDGADTKGTKWDGTTCPDGRIAETNQTCEVGSSN